LGVTIGAFAGTLSVLVILHLIGDWLLQTDWMAKEKGKNPQALAAHVSIWAACFIPAAVWLYNPLWLVWLVGTHLLLDGTGFVRWWMRNVKRVPEADLRGSAWWLAVVVDQVFHLLALVPIAVSAALRSL
jgi:hypothetical protein